MIVVNIPTEENLADALTKGVKPEPLKFHVQGAGAEVRRDRHEMAPKREEQEGEGEESSAQQLPAAPSAEMSRPWRSS